MSDTEYVHVDAEKAAFVKGYREGLDIGYQAALNIIQNFSKSSTEDLIELLKTSAPMATNITFDGNIENG